MNLLLKGATDPLAGQIRRLLRRKHRPTVERRQSSIDGAGSPYFPFFVWYYKAICLYPGIYSAGLPTGAVIGPSEDDRLEYLGHIVTPSGVSQDSNCYLLNVQTQMGGYIDALALEVTVKSGIQWKELSRRRLDENPTACAHLVNHSGKNANVEVTSFSWADVLPDYESGDDEFFDLPNEARKDGAPRYLQTRNLETLFYENGVEKFGVASVCGAAICAIADIDANEELLLDYGFREPLPVWATDWYDSR